MRPGRVLIVDPDRTVCARLRQLLSAEGYTVESSHDLGTLPSLLSSFRPNLILLEPRLTGTSAGLGLRRFQELLGDAHVPFLVLTEDFDPESRLEALRAGAIDYVMKPYDREELLAKIRNWLRVLHDRAEERGPSSGVDRLLELLDREELTELVPQPDVASRYGYSVPRAAEILRPAKAGEELDLLDELAAMGRLEREFYDVIHLCPACAHFHLNFREVCPGCQSANIQSQQLYRHVSCGHVAPRSEFLGADRSCPRCGQRVEPESLRSIGTRFLCVQCGRVFAEPLVACRCLHCGRIFSAEKLERRTIWTYRVPRPGNGGSGLSTEARLALPSELATLLDPDLRQHLLEPAATIERLRQLLAESSPKKPFTALHVEFDPAVSSRRMDKQRAKKLLNGLLRRILAILPGGLTGLYGRSGVLIVLSGIPAPRGRRMAAEMLERLTESLGPVPITVKLAGYPQDGRSAEEILEILEAGIDSLSTAEPNR